MQKTSGFRRSLDEICEEEIASAIKYIVNSQISLLKEDLIREVAKTFGFTRVNEIIESAVKNGIKEAKIRKFINIIENENRIVVGE